MDELFILFAGIVAGFFLAKFLPAFFNPKEYMLSHPPANNFEPMDDPTVAAKATLEEMIRQEEIEKEKERSKTKFPVIFKASRIKDFFTPDEVIFTSKGVTFKIKTLFATQDRFLLYSDISGVDIDEKILFSSITIKAKIRGDITIHNFTNGDARDIKKFVLTRLD
jgi:hypothetical protein